MLEARASLPGLEHVIVVDGERPRGHALAGRGRGLEPRLRRRGGRRRGRPRRHPDADLHLGHDRAAEGRAAVAPQHHVRRAGRRAGHPVRSGREGDLVAAGGAHRRADGPPLHPGDLRRHDHLLPEPARGALVPAAGPADLVLRGAADLGEAEGRPRGDAGRPARGAAKPDPGGARGRRSSACGCASAASRCRASSRRRSPRPTSRCSPSCARCSGSTRRWRSTSAPRRRRSRCSSSSTRSGSSWPSCGGCPRRAASAPCNRPGEVKIGTVGPADAGRRDQDRRRRRAARPRRRS